MMESTPLRQSKGLRVISICLIIIGSWIFLAAVSYLLGIGQMVNHVVDEAARLASYHFDEEGIRNVETNLWRDLLIQLLFGCWFIVCGIGLYLLKRWAWYLTIALTIYGSIHTCYVSVTWIIPLKLVFYLGILIFLIVPVYLRR